MDMGSMEQNVAVLDNMFGFASESDRAKIRGLTAMKLYKFQI